MSSPFYGARCHQPRVLLIFQAAASASEDPEVDSVDTIQREQLTQNDVIIAWVQSSRIDSDLSLTLGYQSYGTNWSRQNYCMQLIHLLDFDGTHEAHSSFKP